MNDVLEVMDHAIRCVRPGVSEEHYQWHKRLTEARAAVSELMDRSESIVRVIDAAIGAGEISVRYGPPWADLRAALARCKGEVV